MGRGRLTPGPDRLFQDSGQIRHPGSEPSSEDQQFWIECIPDADRTGRKEPLSLHNEFTGERVALSRDLHNGPGRDPFRRSRTTNPTRRSMRWRPPGTARA